MLHEAIRSEVRAIKSRARRYKVLGRPTRESTGGDGTAVSDSLNVALSGGVVAILDGRVLLLAFLLVLRTKGYRQHASIVKICHAHGAITMIKENIGEARGKAR